MKGADSEQHDVEQMRAAVADAVRRRGGGWKRVAGPTLAGLLCAAALGPAVAAAAAVGPVVVAGVGVLGSVGTGVLADLFVRVIGRSRNGPEPSTPVVIERLLASEIETAFSRQADDQRALREEVALLLRRIDVVGATLGAVGTDSRGLYEELTGAFVTLGEQFDEFGFIIADVRRAIWAMEASLRRQEAQLRAGRERASEQGMTLRLVLERLTAVEKWTRPRDGLASAAVGVWEGSPYLGLAPFEERHADVFYGRKGLTRQLVQRLAEQLTGRGLLVVIGASGSGKTSLLRAGLASQLASGLLVPGSAAWPYRVFTPTGAPLEELSVHLADLSGTGAVSVYQALTDDPGQAPLLVRQALRTSVQASHADVPGNEQAKPRMVLVVDQFEELFTLVDGDDASVRAQRSAFITALCEAAAPSDQCVPSALVVLSVRSDFLDQVVAYPVLREVVQTSPFIVGPMTEEELRQVITGPAAEAGVSLEPGFVDAVLDDFRETVDRSADFSTGFDVGVLPLLSQAMLTTWEHRDDDQLTIRAYRRAGGVGDAIQVSAEAAYSQLTAEQQQTARAVLTQLSLTTRDGRVARRRVSRAELHAATPNSVDAIVEAFAAKRLIVLRDDSIEIAHEALLRAWPRLRTWLDGDHADRVLYAELANDAATWQSKQHDRSFLYRGARLAATRQAARRWAANPIQYPPLVTLTSDFLRASQRSVERTTWLRRGVVAAVALLTVAALTAAGIAMQNASNASRQQALASRQLELALSRQLIAQSQDLNPTDPVTARRLAAAAWDLAATSEAHENMVALLAEQRGTLVGHTDAVTAVAFSPDGRLLASASDDATVRLWNPGTGEPVGDPLSGHTDYVTAVAFSPDSRLLASTSNDGTVRLWDPGTGEPVNDPLRAENQYGDQLSFTTVAFSPDGSLLAASGFNGTVIWDPATGQAIIGPANVDFDVVSDLAFSPDGSVLASGGNDGSVRFREPTTGVEIGDPIPVNNSIVESIAYSPDGALLATSEFSGAVQLWDPATGQAVGSPLTEALIIAPPTMTDYVKGAVAFSPDGSLLASAYPDATVRLWDPTTRQSGDPLIGHGSGVLDLAFSPDGSLLATASADNTVRLWNPNDSLPLTNRLPETEGIPGGLALHPDNNLLAVASDAGTDSPVQLFSATNNQPVGEPLVGHTHVAYAAAFSPDGHLLASAGDETNGDGTVRLWNIVSGEPRGEPLTGHSEAVYGVAFSPNGRLLASAGHDGTVRLWDTVSGELQGEPLTGHSEAVYGVAFSPDGRLLASAGHDATVRLWDPTTGQPVGQPLTGHTGPVTGVAFSPDSHLLASAGDGTVRLWDPTTGQPVGQPLTGHTDAARDVAFRPDGRLLASSSSDGIVRLWDPATGQPVGEPITGHTDVVVDIEFSPDGNLLVSSSLDRVLLRNPIQLSQPFDSICSQFGPPTTGEWALYVPNEPNRQVCP